MNEDLFRIMHLIPTLEGGGAERQLSQLAIEQKRCGHYVLIVCRRGGVFESKLTEHGIPVLKVGDHKGFSIQLLVKLIQIVSQYKPNILSTWLPQMDIVGGGVALLFPKLKWIASERTNKAAYKSYGLSTIFRRIVFQFSDAVIANSASSARFWKLSLFSKAHVWRIANSVDHNNLPSWHRPTMLSPFCILAVGRLTVTKNFVIILQAIASLRNRIPMKLIIFGEGPLKSFLESVIADLKIGDIVEIRSYSEAWWAVADKVHLFVSASKFEGQPNALLEAMAIGCPTVVSQIEAHREILNDSGTIFFDNNSFQSLALAIDTVYCNYEHAVGRTNYAKASIERNTISHIGKLYSMAYSIVMHEL